VILPSPAVVAGAASVAPRYLAGFEATLRDRSPRVRVLAPIIRFLLLLPSSASFGSPRPRRLSPSKGDLRLEEKSTEEDGPVKAGIGDGRDDDDDDGSEAGRRAPKQLRRGRTESRPARTEKAAAAAAVVEDAAFAFGSPAATMAAAAAHAKESRSDADIEAGAAMVGFVVCLLRARRRAEGTMM
jgi:hypothetical protein